MQIHQLKRNIGNKVKKLVGRGGTRGKTSGRGHKGQRQHGGHGIRPEMRDIIKKIPKLRGYRFNSFRDRPRTVSLSALNEAFKDGEEVSPRSLVEKSLIKTKGGRPPIVKILSDGEITKKIIVSNCSLSATAKEKIEKAGGSITVVK